MAKQKNVEEKLNDVFVKNAPFQIPENGRKAIVRYLPWITLVLAVLMLLSSLLLWQWANTANKIVNIANEYSRLSGTTDMIANVSRLTAAVWIGLVILLVEGVMYLAAFPGLRDRKKQGWNLLFYLAVLNIVYGVVITFTGYGQGLGSLILSIIGSIIGFYLLFQIRSYYHNDKRSHATHKPTTAHKS